MIVLLHPFSLPFIVSALVSAGIAATIWWRRTAPGAISLFVNMLGLTFWSATYAAMWSSTTLQKQLFWLNCSALGVVIIPVTFLTFSLQVSRNERFLTRRLLYVLAVEPAISLLLVWTNDFHHLVHSPAQLWVTDGLPGLHWSPGLWYWADIVYVYLITIAGVWMLVRSLPHNGDLHRWQIGTILAGACIPLFAIPFDASPLSTEMGRLDISPLLFTFSGLLYFYALSRQKFLDLIPVAHSRLIKSMTDGVLVIDLQERVVDINPAACQFLGITVAQAIGRRSKDILTGWEEITRPFWDQHEVRTEIEVKQDIPRYLDLSITPLIDPRKHTTGRMIVFRDVTTRKRDEAALKNVNKQLQEQLTEIRTLRDKLHEQATRDPLTNLFNRRYLDEMLAQELARAEREDYPVSVIMLDVDRFKRVNDTFGHKVGDETLQALATLIVLHIRRFDVACRYGGEEFVIVMPGVSVETAYERAEMIRRAFPKSDLPSIRKEARPTLSFGVAAYPCHGLNSDQLLKSADTALYAAKNSGRNRSVIYIEASQMIQK
jgi:diguanylate cyclase (GGDEF)-like protein/PAS domain S-box-containing protein